MAEITDPDILKQLNADDGRAGAITIRPGGEQPAPSEPPPETMGSSLGDVATRFGRGAARGLAGTAIGGGQVLRMIPPFGTAAQVMEMVPGVQEAEGAVRQFADAPTQGWETAGKYTGMAAPFIAQPETALPAAAARALPMLGRFAPSLGRLAENVGWGAISGGLQPTKTGSFQEHVKGAQMGALAGGVMSPIRGLNSAAGQHAVNLGIAGALAPYFGHHSWAIYHALHHSGAGQQIARILDKVLRPGLAGTAAGQATAETARPDQPPAPPPRREAPPPARPNPAPAPSQVVDRSRKGQPERMRRSEE